MRAALFTLLPLLLSAQAIPERPEKTAAPTLVFEAPKPSEHRVKLKNGIVVFLVNDSTAQPLVTLNVRIKSGAYLDPAGKTGLTSAWCSLLRSGGTETLTPDQLDARLDFLAANLTTRSGETFATLSLNLLEKDFREGLSLVSDLLTRPTFAQERLDLFKRSTLQGLERLNDDPRSIERYQLALLTRGRDHYTATWPTAEELKGLNREDLLAHHARLIHPENLVVALGGRFEETAVVKLLNETLGALKAGKQGVPSPNPPRPTAFPKPGIYVVHKDNPQGRVTFAMPGLDEADPDWVPVEVMNFILGGDFTSRMTYLIRTQEGLSYTVNSRFTPGSLLPGTFTSIFQTKARSVAYGTRLMLGELKRIQEAPVTDQELAMAKGALVNGFPARFSRPAAVADLLMAAHFNGLPEDRLTRYRARVQAVTQGDILRVARKYLPLDKLVIQIVGNWDVMEMGDSKDHPGKLSEMALLPVVRLPLWDPMTRKPLEK